MQFYCVQCNDIESQSTNIQNDVQSTELRIEQNAQQEENIHQEENAQQEENIQQKENIQQEEAIQQEKNTQAKVLKSVKEKSFNTTTGFFIIHIYGEGKESIRKIDVNLSTLSRERSQTIYFTETNYNGQKDDFNFEILTHSARTKATEQNSYAVFSFQFSYTKPAHLKAKHWYSDKTGNERFNFNKSPTDTTTTINNTGHNVTDTTEVIDMQINLTNCGIAAAGVPISFATGHIEVTRGYYAGLNIDPNGGVHDGRNYQYNYGVNCCCTETIINNPKRDGYAFIGWNFFKGNNCNNASFNNGKFVYCGKSTSSNDAGDDNTCTLKAEWIKNDDNFVLPEAGEKFNIQSIIFMIVRCCNHNICYKKYCIRQITDFKVI